MKRVKTLLKEIWRAEYELSNCPPEKIALDIEELEKEGYKHSILLGVLYTGARDDAITFDKEGNPVDTYEKLKKEE